MPYLRLLRLPALFTTFPDVLAGYAIAKQGVIVPWELTWLLVASGLLYLSGMVFNDLFDLEQDRRERPNRPLPAGEIPTTTASRLATVLMLGGVLAAACAGWGAAVVAILLAAMIYTYDAGGKKTLFGPALMGGCRGLNLLLGAACLGNLLTADMLIPLLMAALMGIYVAGITLFARSEAVQTPRADMWGGTILMYLALIGWGTASAANSPEDAVIIVLLILFLIAFQLARRIRPALRTGATLPVQQGVRVMLLSIPMLEALAIIGHGGDDAVPLAIAAALMMIPGQLLSRFIPMT